MLTTIILCAAGLGLIGLGAYLWYRRHLEDENSFGHDDVRWEQIDDQGSSSVEVRHAEVTEFVVRPERKSFGRASLDAELVDESFNEELDRLGRLMREPDDLPAEFEEDVKEQKTHIQGDSSNRFDRRAKLGQNPEMVVSVHVVAKAGLEFHGDQLLAAFEQAGLQHGDRDIFHSYGPESEGSPIHFSAANMLEPGTFNPKEMAATKTSGITLFMLLPGQNNNVQTFEKLLEAGHSIARKLGGELRDGQRSVLTTQGANLIKESIHQFFSRRQMKQGQLNL